MAIEHGRNKINIAASRIFSAKIFAFGVISLSVFFVFGAKSAAAATNINSTSSEHWAWNDVIGWINFYSTGTVYVTSSTVQGYASSSSAGDISLDCATSRSGNICGQSNYSVSNDGVGNLSGWAWNDTYGWISFDCNNNGGCGSSNYRVYIDSTGNFRNYAWNDIIGWIDFNCGNDGTCGSSNYKVITTWTPSSTTGWLESSIYDTQVAGGVQLNSVIWQGYQPAGTMVRFQFASSNSSSGPWSYAGTDGTSNTYYQTDLNTSLKIDYSQYNNNRYFRYKIFLISNASSSVSPRVDDVILNWSP